MQKYPRSLILAALVAALSLAAAACAPVPAAQNVAPTTAPAGPTAAPTEAPAAPTAQSAAPTPAPSAPTEAPAAPVAGALLPADALWLRLGGEVVPLADGAAAHPLAASDPSLAQAIEAAPNGAALAYVDYGAAPQLVVDDNVTGETLRLPADGAPGELGPARFAPDGRRLAYTLLGREGWQLRVADLDSGEERVIGGGSMDFAAGAVTPVLPLSWTPAGLWVQHVLWATDAPAQAISLLDPADGATLAGRRGQHLGAYPAPDGTRVALVVGQMGIGTQPSAGIVVADLDSGDELELAPEQQMYIQRLAWSPDGSRLLYASADSYETPSSSITLVAADGSGPLTMVLGGDGGPLPRDVAWADAATPLLLTVTPDVLRAELYALEQTSFSGGGMRLIAQRPLPAPDALARIAYAPR